jgi:hypothetical protein
VPGTASNARPAIDRVRQLATHTVAMLWLLAGVAVLTAVAETWRYVLLLRSRFGALGSGVVSASDTLVYTGASLALATGVLAAALAVWWLFVARQAAAEVSGYQPARSNRQFFLGMLTPGVNLAVAGSVLAELEHTVERGDRDRRPTPSRLLMWWWAVWAIDGVLTAASFVWRFRDSVQARADGVLLAVLTDLLGATVAVLTVLLVRRFVKLLAPIDTSGMRLMRVVKVSDAPEPPLRATRSWGSPR